tara:strand:+ start:7337 stop:7594 length:258 start_codon:yes stop_codon:yes gene_type:complete
MDISNKYTIPVQQYADTEDYFIEIPDEFCQELNWKEGDTLIWEIKGDNSIVVRKELSVSEYKEQAIREHIQDFDPYYEWIYNDYS